MSTNQKISTDEKNLVLARLDTLPSNMGIAIGNEGNFSVAELKKLVQEDSDLGQRYVELQLDFLRSLKEGSLFE